MIGTVEFLDEEVQAVLSAMPVDIRAAFRRIVELIAAHGLERVHEPSVEHLEGPRLGNALEGQGRDARAAYVTAKARRGVVVHVFVKTRQKTPRRDIAIAPGRAKEVL